MMKNAKRCIRKSSCIDSHDDNTPTSHLPFAPAKHTPVRDVQAYRRNTHMGQPGRTSLTLPSRKDDQAAAGECPQDGQQNTSRRTFRYGGSGCSASSHNRKASTWVYYDPLLGNHTIPVVEVPDLMEQIVEEANFLQAIESVGRDKHKAPGCDRKSVEEVCSWLYNTPKAREKIRQQLLQGTYRPMKVRTKPIPKANGKMRTLGIATVQDRIVQTMILQAVMANLPENTWNKHSYAYLPGSDISNAIAEVNRIREEGYRYGISLDNLSPCRAKVKPGILFSLHFMRDGRRFAQRELN